MNTPLQTMFESLNLSEANLLFLTIFLTGPILKSTRFFGTPRFLMVQVFFNLKLWTGLNNKGNRFF